MLSKKNLPLIIALCIPIVMILLVAAFIYLPSIGKKPAHNFLYLTGSPDAYGYSGAYSYSVAGGKLIRNFQPAVYPASALNTATATADTSILYVYDVNAKTFSQVTLEQAQSYNLDPSQISDDGYSVERGNYGGDFLFGGGSSDYSSWFIKGHNRSQKLNLKINSQNYYNMQFLGWLMN